MNSSAELLKSRLRIYKNSKFDISGETDIFDTALEMTSHIGSIDSELRDTLIYATFAKWILNGKFTTEQLRTLLNISLDDQHLFFQIGEKDTDSVFTRSFSVLLVSPILFVHRQNSFLTEVELKSVHDKLIWYALDERDNRGYVEGKGWAHSTAHLADALDELVQCSYVKLEHLVQIVETIRIKIMDKDYAYINEEDERMVSAVVNAFNRNILTNTEIGSWIESFETFKKTGTYPADSNMILNVKGFLRSLYFRILLQNGSEIILKSILGTLSKISNF